jgi:hypothetical protein
VFIGILAIDPDASEGNYVEILYLRAPLSRLVGAQGSRRYPGIRFEMDTVSVWCYLF